MTGWQMDLWTVSEESYKNGFAAGYAKGQLDSMKIMKEMLNKITVLHTYDHEIEEIISNLKEFLAGEEVNESPFITER